MLHGRRLSVVGPCINRICLNFERLFGPSSTFWEPCGANTTVMNNVTYLISPADAPSRLSAVGLPDPDLRRAFDPVPLQKLYGRVLPQEAEDQICRFLEDIALRLDQLQRGLAARDPDMMLRPARRIALAARMMGLVAVADSASAVRNCAMADDGVALGATMARLERAFDLAVNEVWNMREM